jgi:hypothetical protein
VAKAPSSKHLSFEAVNIVESSIAFAAVELCVISVLPLVLPHVNFVLTQTNTAMVTIEHFHIFVKFQMIDEITFAKFLEANVTLGFRFVKSSMLT